MFKRTTKAFFNGLPAPRFQTLPDVRSGRALTHTPRAGRPACTHSLRNSRYIGGRFQLGGLKPQRSTVRKNDRQSLLHLRQASCPVRGHPAWDSLTPMLLNRFGKLPRVVGMTIGPALSPSKARRSKRSSSASHTA